MAEREDISEETWAGLEPLMPLPDGRSRPWSDHRLAVEGTAWKYWTGAPWRDVPEHFGKWNTIYKRFTRWAEVGTQDQLLAEVQQQADRLDIIDWVVSIDLTIARVHQHCATLPRVKAGPVELQESTHGASGSRDRTLSWRAHHQRASGR